MRIRSVDICGFKSFPDRTVLRFSSGIGCVVGPNGCGKSNLVDAIKWCVGEQSAKSLRGEDMQDVIFAGSADRSPVGFAEVTLTFTSDGGDPFPGSYARLTDLGVTRRLHRDGRSEYLLNGERVRRKDIIDLFLDTGVGANLYSFIEQGRIGEIVQANPERRRTLIDEAAGITRFKARRDEAQTELEATATQLDRVADVTDEMAGRLRTLEGQVARAVRFRRLRARIRQDETLLGLIKYADLAHARREARGAAAASQTDAEAAVREVERREAELTARREAVELAESQASAARDALSTAENDQRDAQQAADAARRAVQDLERQSVAAQRDKTQADTARQVARDERETAEIEALESHEAVGTENAALVDGRAALDRARITRQQSRIAVQTAERASEEAHRAWAAERAAVDEMDRRAAKIPTDLEKAKANQEGAQRELDALLDRRKRLKTQLEARRGEADKAREAVHAAQAEVDQIAAEEAGLRGEARTVEQALQDVRKAAERDERAAAERASQVERDGRSALQAREREQVDRLNRARKEAEAALQRVQNATREAARAAEQRMGAWAQAARQRAEAATLATDRAADAAEQERERSDRAELADVERLAREFVEEAVGSARKRGQDAVEAARTTVEAARTAVQEAEAALQGARDAQSRHLAELARARAERDALIAAIRAESAGERGAQAIRKALNAPNVADRLQVDAKDERWAAAALGERLFAPVVRRDQLAAALDIARQQGRTWIAVADAPFSVEQALGLPVSPDLMTGIGGTERAGSVVSGTGEIIEPGIFVRIGPPTDDGQSLARRRTLVDAEARAKAAESSTSALDSAVRAADVDVKAGRETLAATQRHHQDAIRRADEDERQARLTTEGPARKRVVEAQARIQAAREQRAAANRRARDQRREADQSDLQALAAEGQRQLSTLRAEGERELDAARSRLEAEERQLRSESQAAVEDERARVVAAETEARAQLAAVRASNAEAVANAVRLTTEAGARVSDAQRRRADADARAQGLRAHQFTADVALARAETDVQANESAEERVRSRIDEAHATHEQILADERELRHQIGVARASLALRLTDRDAAVTALEAARAALEAAQSDEDQTTRSVNEREVVVAALNERVRGAEARAIAANARESDAAARSATAERRIGEIIGEAALADGAQRAAEDQVTEKVDAVSGATAVLEASRAALQAARKAVREAEQALFAAVSHREHTARVAAECATRASELQREVEALCARMDERYQLSLPGLLDRMDAQGYLELPGDDAPPLEIGGEPLPAVPPSRVVPPMLDDEGIVRDLVASVEDARAHLREIGEVNLGAYEEYTEVATRFAELAAQRADLETSVASIREAIARLNKTCRERFRDAFDRVNEYFQAAYPRLVGGGTARLSLTDDEDLLEAGVDIFVQPPGKRLQNLALLSGGEKAMAAIALLIALFQVRPSPFCLLDEVDAPLDEGNGHRFNEMLREMSDRTQFIVISHNRKTMEAADVLYGITMPNPGVSRLVSVRLDGA